MKFPHLPTLTYFMRQVRLRNFNEHDVVLSTEEQLWQFEAEYDAKFSRPPKNIEVKHNQNRRLFMEEQVKPIAIMECSEWSFLVWNTVEGNKDIRCWKCSCLYPFCIKESGKETQ